MVGQKYSSVRIQCEHHPFIVGHDQQFFHTEFIQFVPVSVVDKRFIEIQEDKMSHFEFWTNSAITLSQICKSLSKIQQCLSFFD